MTGRENTVKDYHERINKVLMYISEHLEEKMELSKLAEISSFSPYHFHRIMRAYLNEPLGEFIIRLRLDKAAAQLEYSEQSPTEIAYNCGYDVPSSFNKAFKKRFGISPGEYRAGQRSIKLENLVINLNITVMELKPKIKEIKEKNVIYIRSIGDYNGEQTGQTWEKVCDFAQKKRLFGFKTEMIGISHDDPNITETDKLRYDACITVRKEVDPEGEVGFKAIAGGRYAIFEHRGPYSKFNETYNAIYKKWLPESNEKLRDLPCFEKYLNDPNKVKPEKLLTEIYIPIE